MLNFTDLLLPNESYIGYIDDLVTEVRVFRFHVVKGGELLEARVETPFHWFDENPEAAIVEAVLTSLRLNTGGLVFHGLLKALAAMTTEVLKEFEKDEAYKWN